MEAGGYGCFRRTPSRGGGGRRAAVDFVVCFGWADFFRFFLRFFSFVFLRTHTAYCKYEATLPHVPTPRTFVALLNVLQNLIRGRSTSVAEGQIIIGNNQERVYPVVK